MLADFRYALRLFARSPLFAAAVVLVLGLGIGASTTVFTLVDAYLLKPLPFPEPERLVAVWRTQRPNRSTNPFSALDLLDLTEQAKSFSHVAALNDVELNLAGSADVAPESVPASVVSAGFFPTLGVGAALGRVFSADEDVPGRDQVVVLSDALFRRRFGADPSVLGRTLTLDGEPFRVLGVMPPSFQAPASLGTTQRAALWVPAALTREKAGARNWHSWQLLTRLRPGVSLERADAEVGAIARGLEQTYPDTNTNKTFYAVSLQDHLVADIKPSLTILFVATLLLLAIASANVALLLLARAASRESEAAVRSALGATRPRLVRQFLLESLLLALGGGLVGFALSFAGVGLVAAGFRDSAYAAHALRPDGRVLAFALALSSLAGLGFGLAPAWRGSTVRLAELLKEGAARSTSSTKRRRAQGALLVAEVALSAVLLAGSAAVARGFYKTLNAPLGFSSEGVLSLSLHLPQARYADAASVRAFHDGLLARLRALPSVSAVGAANFIPLAGGNSDRLLSIEGLPPQPPGQEFDAEAQRVSGDYFRAMGISLRRGRLFTEADREQGAPVMVVDETFVRRFLPGEEPLGKRVKWSGDDQAWCEIVGVVSDVRYTPWQTEARPASYVPYAQGPAARNATFVLKSAASPAALAHAAREELRQIDAELPVADAKTLDVLSLESVANRRFTLWLVTVFAASALVLTALGLFGLVSYQTQRRSRELAVRMALGAAAGDVVRLVVRDTSRLLAAGLLLGLPAALLSGRLLASRLQGVPATDPLSLTATALLLGLVGLAACAAPARRAARTPPALVLRND